jgi:phospholipase/lecithinase/hemolysin
VGQLAAGATNPQTAAQAIGLAAGTEAARPGSTQTTITQAAIGAAAVQPGNSAVASPAVYGPMVAKATTDATAAGAKAGADYATAHGPDLVAAMTTAGTELATLVKTQIVANGANFVTVNNLPDVATTPSGRGQSASTQALINAMVSAFNTALTTGLSSETKVLIVDVFAASHDQATNPGPYGLTNVSETACDLTPAKNPLASSLVCNASNVKSGDISHWSFADDVHPTPFTNLLLARYVAEKLVVKGWL